MKARVDPDICTGCGLCPEICPEVFDMGADGKAFAKRDDVPGELEESAREAAQQCPVEAIIIEE
ncbi:MAG: ferredoxin [Planctomycetota bacterium]